MIELFFAELRRSWIQLQRYPLEAIGGVLISTALFYGLFLGASYIAGPNVRFGNRLDAIVVGYILWVLVTLILFDIAGTLQSEAQTGTLKQLFLSPFGAAKVFLVRAVANLSLQLMSSAIVLCCLMVLTGRFLTFSPALILPLLTIVLGAYGLALVVGAMVLIFKRLQQLFSILQFGILFLLNAPLEEWEGTGRAIASLLPLSSGAGMLRDLLVRQSGFNWWSFSLALVNGFAYLIVGLAWFRYAEQTTKRAGRLSGF